VSWRAPTEMEWIARRRVLSEYTMPITQRGGPLTSNDLNFTADRYAAGFLRLPNGLSSGGPGKGKGGCKDETPNELWRFNLMNLLRETLRWCWNSRNLR